MYFSGLMVFLGLLGAFMGLMKTVHSVSDLIGGMDMSGKGGTDAFGKMIEGMAHDFGLQFRNVDNRVFEVDHGEMRIYEGNYDYYVSQKPRAHGVRQ